MKKKPKLPEEYFLQQFPNAKQFLGEGEPFRDWWEVGGNPDFQGPAINLADLANANRSPASVEQKPVRNKIKLGATPKRKIQKS